MVKGKVLGIDAKITVWSNWNDLASIIRTTDNWLVTPDEWVKLLQGASIKEGSFEGDKIIDDYRIGCPALDEESFREYYNRASRIFCGDNCKARLMSKLKLFVDYDFYFKDQNNCGNLRLNAQIYRHSIRFSVYAYGSLEHPGYALVDLMIGNLRDNELKYHYSHNRRMIPMKKFIDKSHKNSS